ncbi:tryptophan halogenase family protein [Colwellia echini]|uniref:Tryptophan 7-halogenase n=1 Tax=Colwellia echini TaxID=1982103 RepID=A0ABY3MYV3_9GAMM|nr:tryptophan halogenase family protein [Colwellia echini]TYK66403.1 tryptophan 7-halogenase [Colwellia echini]
MNKAIKQVIIVGGGTAGWLTAGVIAAEHNLKSESGLQVTLIESPEVNTVGVGEGTWPTMRETLDKIGINETDLFRECEASFKQGSKFSKWVNGAEDDHYCHPFVLPQGYGKTDLVFPWQKHRADISFADAVSFQGHVCEQGRAPKLITTPEYAGMANYAYHLDAVKLGMFLQKHCIEKLGVNHVIDHVTEINSADNGDILSITTKMNGDIAGDLFIDCSGLSSMLLGKHFKVPFISKKHILFNDTALAVQVPYLDDNSPIASQTISTAQSAGWIWDIGLPSRRGVGYVYSSEHTNETEAEVELRAYIESSIGKTEADKLSVRKISFNPGHREKFWHKNCVAIGMASGFLEPLEASALVLVELAAAKISREMPTTRETMDIVSKRYNKQFLYRWERIIDFLKLHYVLTKRTDSAYWVDNCALETIPESLQELMTLWKQQPPGPQDFHHVEEVFPSASWQYILYGMGFETAENSRSRKFVNENMAHKFFSENVELTKKYLSVLPTNRELINKIKQYGMQKI